MEKAGQLPEAQLAIMEILWEHQGAMMFADLMEALEAQRREWKPNTVLTLLARLNERGMLQVRKHGRLNEYVACVTQEVYLQEQAKKFVDSVFGGNVKHLVSALAGQSYLSQEEYRELQAFWDGKKG